MLSFAVNSPHRPANNVRYFKRRGKEENCATEKSADVVDSATIFRRFPFWKKNLNFTEISSLSFSDDISIFSFRSSSTTVCKKTLKDVGDY